MQLFSIPRSEPPKGLRAGRLTTPDGANLRYAIARPEKGPVRGTVTILPGRADYIERYYESIEELLSRRYAVAIPDWRGQGLSARLTRNRLRGHIRSFAQYDTDLRAFMNTVVLPECPAPHYAIAASMGANIALRASTRHIWFDRVLLVSPMIEIKTRRLPRWWWRFLSAVAVRAGLGKLFVPGQRKRPLALEDFPGNRLTSDYDRFALQVEMQKAHPELSVAGPTLGWLHAAIVSCGKLMARAAKHETPLWRMLAVAAGDDGLVSTEATRLFCARTGSIACLVIPGARHDILQEADRYRQPLWAAFDSFISQEQPAASFTTGQDDPDNQDASSAARTSSAASSSAGLAAATTCPPRA